MDHHTTSTRQTPFEEKRERGEEANLRDRSCEYNNFVQLSNPLHELVNPRSLNDVDVVVVALDLYRDGEIGLM